MIHPPHQPPLIKGGFRGVWILAPASRIASYREYNESKKFTFFEIKVVIVYENVAAFPLLA